MVERKFDIFWHQVIEIEADKLRINSNFCLKED